ncbi:gephyrin-like molybdotransferase Glp [Litchfieldella xinjiangensis]|uniref:molybdopterin molybdotransferase MoeA n=1 Tax=Litchfieldella xinjiangensis TaxID=1166948 RepID=UPI0005BBEAF4|nr:gephyrin-like molybdotransferase Glp [Halomonas xinjiangensis]
MSLSCFDLGERMLSLEEALAALDQFTPAALGDEACPLEASQGRILAEDVRSTLDVPQNTNAAMDGIALAWPTREDAGPERWPLVGESLAGHGYSESVPRGTAVAITTGAPLPPGTDTVIMSEQLEFVAEDEGTWVGIQQPDTVRQGQNVRHAGEDVARGQLALSRGTRLRPQHQGLLASLGVAAVRVHRRPRVALFSTGDEVAAPGEALPGAGIYDANRFSIRGLLERLGCDIDDLGILPDDPQRIREGVTRAAETADLLITSGGVSVGQADWVRHVLTEAGDLGFWRIAIRPGRPLAFGQLGKRGIPFFGLPGNPVAVMVTFLQFVQPMLRHMQGECGWSNPRLSAIADEPLASRRGRVDFLRGVYHCDESGQLHVRSTGRQGSGILSSMVAANCLIVITADREGVDLGEVVTIQPFGELT